MNDDVIQADPAWAWSPYEPSPERPWDRTLAAHLFRRAGFGATWAELERAVVEGPAGCVDRLLAGGEGLEEFQDEARRTADTLLASGDTGHLPAWWLHVMVHTPHPLLEKMTLFWHGHFATSAAKVAENRLMMDQNHLLREYALGRFGPLLDAMAKDPAMLVWLDSATNRKAHPNENFAREVMELFSLGLGNYTERDIKEAARAFTGFEIKNGSFRFNRYQHDRGEKEVLGQRGAWQGEDVIRILLSQQAAGEFIASKLFRYFVSETAQPSKELLAPLAEGWRERDYDTTWLAGTILRSNLFFSPQALYHKIKCPVDFAVGLVRVLEGTTNTYALADDLESLGQRPFFPPNVKGWDGGTEWINSSTLLSRANLVWSIAGGQDDRYANRVRLDRLAALVGLSQPVQIVRRLADLLLGVPPPEAVLVQLTALAADDSDGNRQRLARVVQGIATLPEFQLA